MKSNFHYLPDKSRREEKRAGGRERSDLHYRRVLTQPPIQAVSLPGRESREGQAAHPLVAFVAEKACLFV